MANLKKKTSRAAAAVTLDIKDAADSLARSSPIPLYHQLATRLRDEIISGTLVSGARYYSDRELLRRYGVSLLTARQAMSELTSAGLLERRQGKGTFIASAVAKLRAAARENSQDAILFTGWSAAALTGWDAAHFRGIFEGIEEEARARNLCILFDDLQSAPGMLAAEARKRGILGALALLGSDAKRRAALLASAGVRVVTVSFALKGLPAIMADDYGGGKLAVEHLLKLGHRKLAHLNSGEPDFHWTAVKKAYRDCIAAAGLSIDENLVLEGSKTGGTIQAGFDLAKQAFSNEPALTALSAGNDFMAIGALRYLRERGVQVPKDVSVIGFDNLDAAEICTPSLSTIAVDRRELGRGAVSMLLQPEQSAERRLVCVRLIQRESTAARG